MRSLPTLIAFSALLALSPLTARAQLGGLVKRGAERAAEKAVDKAAGDKAPAKELPAPAFDAEVLELTAPRLDQVVRGLNAWNDARAKADVPGAMKAYEASLAKEQGYATRYSEQRQAFIEKNQDIEECRREVLDAQRDSNQAELDRKMASIQTNPALMQAATAKSIEWAPRLQALMAGTDSVKQKEGLMQYQREMAKVFGMQLDTDSTKANAKCGRPAPKPTWLAEWDAAEAETRRLGERVREAETAGEKEAAAASGLTGRQFAIARERVESFVNGGGMGFSKKEKSVLAPRKAELQRLFPAG